MERDQWFPVKYGPVWDLNWREGSHGFLCSLAGLGFESVRGVPLLDSHEVPTRQSQDPTMLVQVTSASVLLCDTAVCLLHAREMGANV